jgi:uncharacterized protein YqgV (UPF0045/DUF77 family)
MGTLIEGEWEDVMQVIKSCHDQMQKASPRIYCVVKIDSKLGEADPLSDKVASVEEKIGHKLKT